VTRWLFEPGHTEAGFKARHMMVTWVRGLFKDIHGELEFDWDSCLESTFSGVIDATKLWTGEPKRDEHLRSADFFDVENFPQITFEGRFVERLAATAFRVESEVTIRGTTLTVPLHAHYLGEWQTPFWVGDENKGLMRRIGFEARTRVNRLDFGVSWQDQIPGGGVVAGEEIDLVLDVEAIAVEDLESTGAIEYYREVYAPHCGGLGREAA
jgi:polyisoprenoid-binding protein YceI